MYRIKIVTMFCVFWTLSSGTCMIWRNFSLLFFLPIESRLHPDLAECEPSLPKPFRNSPVIYTKFGNDTHVRVPTITEHNTTESRQSRVQCGRANCDRIAFRQYLIITNYGDSFLTDIFRQRRFTVWSLSDLCRITFCRIGKLSRQVRSFRTMRKTQIGLESD